jgi:hypothetical protein
LRASIGKALSDSPYRSINLAALQRAPARPLKTCAIGGFHGVCGGAKRLEKWGGKKRLQFVGLSVNPKLYCPKSTNPLKYSEHRSCICLELPAQTSLDESEIA